MSGRKFRKKKNTKKLLAKLDSNAVLYIPEIDRLGRNYEEILEQWRVITKRNKGGNCCIRYAIARYKK